MRKLSTKIRFIAAIAVTLTTITVSTVSFAGPTFGAFDEDLDFPKGPRVEMTPGSVCRGGGTRRYPERIAYCTRSVDSRLKREIIRAYDREFGYHIGEMPRGQFKIDHYIPLCAGGSNEADNLWPQHKSVYDITDPLEPVLCEKMSKGRLLQAEAIELIKEAKNDLSKAPAILRHIQSL